MCVGWCDSGGLSEAGEGEKVSLLGKEAAGRLIPAVFFGRQQEEWWKNGKSNMHLRRSPAYGAALVDNSNDSVIMCVENSR